MKKKWVKALEAGYSFHGINILTDAQKALKKKNGNAWNYLVMACNGKQFDIITSETEMNAYQGWKLLKDKYEPAMDEALVNVQEEFVTCKMAMTTEDLWLLREARTQERDLF
jgi:hypothetical protein